MTESQRNLLIIVIIALIVMAYTPALAGVAIVGALVRLAFTVLLIWWLGLLYTRNAATIANIPAGPRMVLQIAALVLMVAVVTGMLVFPFLPWPFGWADVYPLIFWPLVLACGFGIWWGWQHRTSRW